MGVLRAWLFAMGLPTLASAANVELTGKVLDYATKQPIEGAYVIAGYHEKIVDPAQGRRATLESHTRT